MTALPISSAKTRGLPTILWPLLALALILLFNLAFTRGFFHIEIKDGRLFGSLIDIVKRASPVMLVGIGMTLVIATGGVDLSVGAVMAIAGAVAALMVTQGWSLPASFAAAIAAGLIAGMWNGALVALLQIQPIVATLVLMVAGRGIAQLLTHSQHVDFRNAGFAFVANGFFLGLPFPITMVAVALAAMALLTRKTAIGLFVESVGNNPVASRYAGINQALVKLFVYAVTGALAGIAGLVAASDIKSADPNSAGLYIELDAILAVVIGGTALSGGRFHLLGTMFGALIIQSLTTTILTRGIDAQLTLVVKGAVVIVVCLLQSEKVQQAMQRLWSSGRGGRA
jgi:ribose/xylose/arabinose/galactoside ABC-type transport system permease subunit